MTTALQTPEGPGPTATVSRRGFVGLIGAAGFAAAIQPVAASAIETDADGLVTERLDVPVAGATLPAYVARPKSDSGSTGPHPVVLIAHEIFGVHEYIRDTARRFAKAGYVAVVPDLYVRAGDPSGMTDFAEIGKIVRTATNDQVMADLAALVTYLEGKTWADTDRLAITGFCWGGSVTWMFAATDPRVKAGVAWYGRLMNPGPGPFSAQDERAYPIDLAGKFHGPVLGLYGGQDRGIPVSDVDAMNAALKAAGDSSEIILYPDAQHGFHADYRPSYDAEAATDGWQRALDWFRRHGV